MAKSSILACFIFVSYFTIISSASLRFRRSTDDTQLPDAMLQLLQRYDIDDNIEPVGGLTDGENQDPIITDNRFLYDLPLNLWPYGKLEDRLPISRTRKHTTPVFNEHM
ncbi:uncharacterized protein LOC117100028 [Anneissia japonica]|uniref:uncharacterized protein LOC117100028 n=1 Tax=Anneissia japonica TaxID=1529436 RepID=UPI00142589D5|nr:uncharacterized protein LOC117100028 [Anneissia japonica]